MYGSYSVEKGLREGESMNREPPGGPGVCREMHRWWWLPGCGKTDGEVAATVTFL